MRALQDLRRVPETLDHQLQAGRVRLGDVDPRARFMESWHTLALLVILNVLTMESR